MSREVSEEMAKGEKIEERGASSSRKLKKLFPEKEKVEESEAENLGFGGVCMRRRSVHN